MRNIVLSVLLAIMFLPLKAQEKPFIDHLTIPVDVGVAFSPIKEFTNSSVYFKTCLEYREAPTHGLWVALEYDEYAFDYENYRFKGVNIVEGTFKCSNVLFGAGYRIAFRDESERDNPGTFSIGFLVQPGVSFTTMKTVDSADTDYHLKDVSFSNFAVKGTIQLEYFLNKTFALLLSHGFTQPFGDNPIPTKKSHVSTVSLGFVTFF